MAISIRIAVIAVEGTVTPMTALVAKSHDPLSRAQGLKNTQNMQPAWR